MLKLDRATLDEIIDVLEPELREESTRRAYYDLVFTGKNSQPDLDLSGASYEATLHMVTRLQEFGTLDSGMPALWALCEVVMPRIGADRQKRLEAVRDKIFAEVDESAPAAQPVEPPARAYAFISYSSQNKTFVDQLITDLQAAGIAIWIDHSGLKPGTTNWENALRAAVRDAYALVLVASPSSLQSNYVQAELDIAKMYNLPVLPVWAEGAHWMESAPMALSRTQYVDLRATAYADGLIAVIEQLRIFSAQSIERQAEDAPPPLRNPYKGLRAFQESDTEFFFGRETLVSELLQVVDSARFLAIVGASGAGKSSVVRAGLLPRWRKQNRWAILPVIVPGAHPLETLALLFAERFNMAISDIRKDLDKPDGHGLYLLANRLASREQSERVLLYVDQFEEVFTLTVDEDERRQFIDLLTKAVNEPRGVLTVLLSLRADFSDRPLKYPDLGRLLEAHSRFVLPMTIDDLHLAIEQPAAQVGLGFEEGLVGDLLFEVRDEAGSLPLLQFTLDLLYRQCVEKDGEHRLTRIAYRTLGGVRGALAQHAEATYNELRDDEHRRMARVLFLRLIEPGATEQDTTRRRARRADLTLPDAAQTAVLTETAAAFTDARLLVTDGSDEEATVEVSHEALIREWERLRTWLTEGREDIRLQNTIAQDAADWRRNRQRPDDLYRGVRLVEAQAWAKHNPPSIDEQTFIDASAVEEARRITEEEGRIHELNEATSAAKQARSEADEATEAAKEAQNQADEATKTAKEARNQADEATEAAKEAQNQADEASQRARTNRNSARAAIFAAIVIGIIAAALIFTAQQQGQAARESEGTAVAQVTSANAAVSTAQQAQDVAANREATAVAQVTGANAAVSTAHQAQDAAANSENGANTQVALIGAVLTPIPVTLTAVEGEANAARLAAAAVDEFAKPNGSAELTALLAIRSLEQGHSGAADTALQWASDRLYARGIMQPGFWISAVAFSPDGKFILAGGGNSDALLWDAQAVLKGQATKPLRHFTGHTDSVASVAFSPDGKYALTGSYDQTARLWDVATGQSLGILTGPASSVASVAFSPDGKYALTGSLDNLARLWDVVPSSPTFGQVVRIFTGHTDRVASVTFSPDGKYALTASFDQTARLWGVASGQSLRTFTGHTAGLYNAVFSPDGKYALTGSFDETARLWDVVPSSPTFGQSLHTFTGHTSGVTSVAFSPDGKYALTGSDDHTARLWDIAPSSPTFGQSLRTFTGHTNSIWSVAFSPDGKYALTGSSDETTRLWDVTGEQSLHTLTGHTASVTSGVFSPDGKYALTGSSDDTARLWDVATGQSLRTFTGHSKALESVAFSPDGKYALTGSDDGTARLWDVATGQSLHTFAGHTAPVNTVAFSPDGKYVLTGSNDHTARLWDAAPSSPTFGQSLRTFLGHTDTVSSVAFSPDGKYALIGSSDDTTLMWDAAPSSPTFGQFLHIFPYSNLVRSMAFSPDGKYVLIGGDDYQASLWDAVPSSPTFGQVIRTFTGHTGGVTSVAFSPDGKYALTGSFDATARLWDVATGQSLRTFTGHADSVWSVAFSPDGKYALIAGNDNTVQLWDVDYRDLMVTVCARLLRDLTSAERQQVGIQDDTATCPQFADQDHPLTMLIATPTALPMTLPVWTPIASPTIAPTATPSPTEILTPTQP